MNKYYTFEEFMSRLYFWIDLSKMSEKQTIMFTREYEDFMRKRDI